MSADEEKQKSPDNIGFAGLADFIASDKEHSASLYRQFERIAARNILYLQSELRELELQIEEYDREDAEGELEMMESAMDWQLLCERAAVVGNEKERERLDVIRKIREKVKEYQETVLRNAQMLHLARPSKQVHDAFQGHFQNRHKKRQYPRLAGMSADLYDNEFRHDLVSLAMRKDDDRLTTWLRHHYPRFFQRSKNANSSVAYLSEYRLQLFVGAINILIATGLLLERFIIYTTSKIRKNA